MSEDDLLRAIHAHTNGGHLELRWTPKGVTAMCPDRIGTDGQCGHYVVGHGETVAGAMASLAAMLRVVG